MAECKYHQSLETKLDRVAEDTAAIKSLLAQAVVKKDELYQELNKVRSENRKTVGILTGVLIVLGGALQALLKTL